MEIFLFTIFKTYSSIPFASIYFIIFYFLCFSNLSISGPFDKELETGKNYLFGINEVKNEKLAIHWLKIAHNHGNNEATYLLGYCFTFDICNQNNPIKGTDLLETAFKNGLIKAGYDLGIYFLKRKNNSIAKNYFLKSQSFPLSPSFCSIDDLPPSSSLL